MTTRRDGGRLGRARLLDVEEHPASNRPDRREKDNGVEEGDGGQTAGLPGQPIEI